MGKVKYLTLLFMLLALILIIPTISNAANDENIYQDTKQGIEWSYETDDSGKNITNLRCKTTTVSGAVTIPSTIDGKTVISLNQIDYVGTFEGCSGITQVTLPNTITIIGESAFENCTGLKNITIPNSVVRIGAYAFCNCAGITQINFSEKLNYIGKYAFSSCKGIKALKIPNTVTTIGEYAFEECSGIKELTLSENLTSLNKGVFRNCSGLTTVVIPNSVTSILSGGTWYGSEGAFYNCTNLEKILIPDSVATINKYAFEGCDKLTIYGNDGMASKKYAEENDINFDYISNWNKQNSGADVTPPTVKSMQVAYDSIKNYSKDNAKEMYMVSTGAKLTIKVNFSENIKGTTVPTLTIKIGNGQNIQLTQGTIGGATITYTYTLKSTDKGVISVVSFTGGNITDNAGNSATLSVKTLTEEYGSYLINANGTADNTNNSGNTNSGTNAGQQNSNTQNNNTQNDNNAQNGNGTAEGTQNNTQNIKDTTTAVGKLPQTGVGIGLLASIVLILFGSIFAYFKLRNLKGI